MSHKVYMDNAATTALRPEAFGAMRPFFEGAYGNPSSIYELARESKRAIEAAREKVAAAIGAKPPEIYFTGSGTEADNWAIIGTAQAHGKKGNHIITSAIEHHAVLHTCQYLEKNGFDVTYLPVNDKGLVSVEDVEHAIRPTTILITIMFANNEIGTIQPVPEIGALARKHGILFHTDAVQAVGAIPVHVAEQNIDMLSLSAHKLYGPKGTGALYIRKGVQIRSLIHGGAQERNRRAGTENVPGIVGLGSAIELKVREMDAEAARLRRLSRIIKDGVLGSVPHTRLNGDWEKRLPGNVNISFEFIEGESLLLMLDMKGISASSGSACTSGSLDPSHVLLAIGLPHEKAHGSLRVSLGKDNTEEDARLLLEVLPPIVERLREMSPLYEEYIKGKA